MATKLSPTKRRSSEDESANPTFNPLRRLWPQYKASSSPPKRARHDASSTSLPLCRRLSAAPPVSSSCLVDYGTKTSASCSPHHHHALAHHHAHSVISAHRRNAIAAAAAATASASVPASTSVVEREDSFECFRRSLREDIERSHARDEDADADADADDDDSSMTDEDGASITKSLMELLDPFLSYFAAANPATQAQAQAQAQVQAQAQAQTQSLPGAAAAAQQVPSGVERTAPMAIPASPPTGICYAEIIPDTMDAEDDEVEVDGPERDEDEDEDEGEDVDGDGEDDDDDDEVAAASAARQQQAHSATIPQQAAVESTAQGVDVVAPTPTPTPDAPCPVIASAVRNSIPSAMNPVVEESDESSDSDTDQMDFYEETNNPYAFIRRLPFLPRLRPMLQRPLAPKNANTPKATLVLDLDETLVHCSTEPMEHYDLFFPVMWGGNEYKVYAKKRPHLAEFMREVSQLFEVVVFTASQQVYADKLLTILDPQFQWFHHRVFRDACVCVEGNYLKDLTILGRDLATTIIVDNSPQAFGYQYNNGIPIESWYDREDDNELVKLLPFLRDLARADDVRPIIRSQFKLYKRIERHH